VEHICSSYRVLLLRAPLIRMTNLDILRVELYEKDQQDPEYIQSVIYFITFLDRALKIDSLMQYIPVFHCNERAYLVA
jgi:hypothetical protein